MFITILFLSSCSETKTIFCSAGKTNPVQVLRNPTKAYPVYARDFDASVKATVNIVDNINVDGDITFGNKIKTFRETLNQESARMEMLVKANYLAYNSRPCDEKVRDEFFILQKSLADKTYELEKLRQSLQNALTGRDPASGSRQEKVEKVIEEFGSEYKFLQ
jgi:hypothetical protein